jgi:hypothetical protein
MNIREFNEATEGMDPETPVLLLVKSGKFCDDVRELDVVLSGGEKVILA